MAITRAQRVAMANKPAKKGSKGKKTLRDTGVTAAQKAAMAKRGKKRG